MRFRNRLLLLVLAILVPAFIGAAVAVAYVYVEQQESQERVMAETGHAFALLIDNEMSHQEGILRTLAASPALAEGDMAEFYAHAQRAAEGVGAVAILYDLAGKTVLNTRRPLGVAVPGRDPSNLPELVRRFGAAGTVVSDIFYAPPVRRYDFMMQVPVRIDKQLRYYLLLGLDVGIVQQLLTRQHFPATWLATVVDRNGRIVARSRDAAPYVGTLLREGTRRRLDARHDAQVFDSQTLDGIPVRTLVSTVPNTGWKVLINIPTAEIRRVPLKAAALLAAIMSVLLVLALAAGRWFANRATAPIEYLGRCADRLGNGDEVPYHPHGLEEIDNVARRMTEASKQIGRAQRELEQRVSEAIRATEQAQGALLKGQRLESLGRLTAGIAHEFNNLLQTLTTALQLAAMQAKEPKLQALIDTCKRTVGRATKLTGQLGSFGRVQEGRLLTVDPTLQLESALQLIRGGVGETVAIDTDFAAGLWPITVEPLQFDLALLNLAINARDAMDGEGVLRISAHNATLATPPQGLPPGDYLHLTVADAGIGMTPEVLAHALDPFYTTKAPGQGTGLGLPQAYAFATQANGLLTLDSAPGRGTRVHIWLPRADAAPVPTVQEAPAAPVLLAQGSGSVLFVEDDPLVREAVAGGLRQAGFTVRVAESGDAALALLDGGLQVDVVFSDVVMPGSLSGIDLARALRRRWPELPVVLATGYTERRVALPGVPILAKPYDIAQAVNLLGTLVAQA
jgi:signal transduction histidine kinase/CheY-like chemotaxis protein